MVIVYLQPNLRNKYGRKNTIYGKVSDSAYLFTTFPPHGSDYSWE
jgi:hypothetical protein